jgi:UDP-glucose 6-dehydrogenase
MLAKSLKDIGIDVIAHDPMVSGPARVVLGDAVRFFPTAREAIAHADVVVIATPWAEYADISPEWVADGRTRFILDCWRQLTPGLFTDQCKIVQLGHQETMSAAVKRLAAE